MLEKSCPGGSAHKSLRGLIVPLEIFHVVLLIPRHLRRRRRIFDWVFGRLIANHVFCGRSKSHFARAGDPGLEDVSGSGLLRGRGLRVGGHGWGLRLLHKRNLNLKLLWI